ncbi:guanylate kinase [Candidatus Odyssella thessalonicensis]|nr:guanylate kinase [Candidatus Odyssella thessalonicensis]
MTNVNIPRRGFMLCLSSPSGAGKTSICGRVLQLDSNTTLSISVTTRPMRPGEVNGKDYFFVSTDDYKEMVANGDLLEHATVFGNGYGTPKKFVFDSLEAGKDVLFDIDWQGTQQLSHIARADLVSVFILPPTVEALEQRLRSRAQDPDNVIRSRMAEAAQELSHWPEYNYVIVNDCLDNSVAQVQAIITAERLRRSRQIGLTNFVNGLRGVE